jgi:preprotein translocase subunit YajC
MESHLFISPAYAQGFLGGDGATSLITNLVPFILIFVIMWFLIIRPQQKRVREHQEMIKNVRRGDTIVTTGGIIGKVTKVIDGTPDIDVEIASGVNVKVARAMISEVRTKGEPVKA